MHYMPADITLNETFAAQMRVLDRVLDVAELTEFLPAPQAALTNYVFTTAVLRAMGVDQTAAETVPRIFHGSLTEVLADAHISPYTVEQLWHDYPVLYAAELVCQESMPCRVRDLAAEIRWARDESAEGTMLAEHMDRLRG